MDSFRKIIGVLFMVFIALPTLFAVIWAVGMTKAVVSPEFLSDMPREIIKEIPQHVDEMIKEMQDEEFTTDQDARAWIKAIAQADTSPKELMEEIGLLNWLQNELSASLQDLGDILRGEIEPKQITLNMRPLKEALQHKAIDRYIMKLIENFPPCGLEQLEEWRDEHDDSLPACRPDPQIVEEALREWRRDVEHDIDDEVELFEDARFLPRGLSTARTVVSLTYLLFLIPAAFIAFGALIGASSKVGFLQWSGISTIIGGIVPLGLAFFTKKIVPLAIKWFPYEYTNHDLSIQFQEMLVDKVGGIMTTVVDQLFSPVIAVAGTVCVIGIVLYALSFVVTQPEAESPTTRTEAESKSEEKPAQTKEDTQDDAAETGAS